MDENSHIEEKQRTVYLQIINEFKSARCGDSQMFESMILLLNDGFDLKESHKKYLKELQAWFKDDGPHGRNATKIVVKPKCYVCKNELGRFSTKHTVEEIHDKQGKVPDGMTNDDRICYEDFMLLTSNKDGEYFKLKLRVKEYKKIWDKNGVIQFKNERMAILQRSWGQQVEFIIAYDDLTNEGYRCIVHDEGKTGEVEGMTGGLSSYFYFQKMKYVR